MFDDECDDIFVTEYESFLIDDESKYDVFEFDDLCCAADYLIASTSDSDFPSTSRDLKPLLNALKHSFLGPNESLPMIIASDLDRDQEEDLIVLLRENKEAIGWILGDVKGFHPSIVKHRIYLADNVNPTMTVKGI